LVVGKKALSLWIEDWTGPVVFVVAAEIILEGGREGLIGMDGWMARFID
jgi:hypothetical protein